MMDFSSGVVPWIVDSSIWRQYLRAKLSSLAPTLSSHEVLDRFGCIDSIDQPLFA